MSRGQIYPAKVTQPSAKGALRRKRLFRLIERSKAVWITGPAGSGKTILASSYVEDRGLPCLWYRTDSGDNDLPTFFYYLGLAAKKANPRKRKPMPLLTLEYLMGTPVFIKRWFEELYSRLKPPFLIVFDNLQETTGEGINDALRECLSQLPDGIKVALISRRMPPANLARFRASGKISIMGWDELRLTEREALGIAGGKRKAARELHRKADGWVAGLKLLLEAKSGAVKIQDVKAGSSEVFDYLASEVFDRASIKEREFLLKTSLLPSITTHTAGEITETADAKAILNKLHRENYFTERLPGRQAAYRYHPLFREFLHEQVSALLGAEELMALKRRASAALLGEDMYEAAASLCIEAADWEGLRGLVRSRAPELLIQGRNGILLGWLSAVPGDVLKADPWLLFWAGAGRMPFDPAGSQSTLELAFQIFNESGDAEGLFLSWAAIVDSINYQFDDFKQLNRWAARLDELETSHGGIPPGWIETAVASSMFYSLVMMQPLHPHFDKWRSRALEVARTSPDLNMRIRILHYHLYYLQILGDYQGAEKVMSEIKSLAKTKDAPYLVLLTEKMSESIEFMFEGNTEACIKTAEEAIELADRTGIHLFDFMTAGEGAWEALRIGDIVSARKFMKYMESVPVLRPWDESFYLYLKAIEAILQNDTGIAWGYARKSLDVANHVGVYQSKILVGLICAEASALLGEYERALAHVDEAQSVAKETVPDSLLSFSCHLVRAQVFLRWNRKREGLESLRHSLAFGREMGFVNIPLWIWPREDLSCLCATALEHGIEPEYVIEIIRKKRITSVEGQYTENWPYPIRINTMGRFEVLIDEEPLSFSGKAQKRPIELLKAIIALGGGTEGVQEETVSDALWPDADGDAAHIAFTSALHRLRKLLKSTEAVLFREGRLTMNPEVCQVDALVMEQLYDNEDATETALWLYKGSFLADDAGAPWAVVMRERLRSKYLTCLSALAGRLAEEGRFKHACELYSRGFEEDTMSEDFCRGLMLSLSNLGRRSEAVSVYRKLVATLHTAFDISPSKKTTALFKKIISD